MNPCATTGARPCLIVWDGGGTDDTLTVLGPFSGHHGAAGLATNPDNNPTKEPGWQTLNLRDPTKVRVLAPGHGRWAAVDAAPLRRARAGHAEGDSDRRSRSPQLLLLLLSIGGQWKWGPCVLAMSNPAWSWRGH